MDKYKIKYEDLKGEELLALDEVLSDIIVFNEEQEDEGYDFYRFIEHYHEQEYNGYCKSCGYVPQYSCENPYDDNLAWMYAQKKVVQMELDRLDDDKIDNFFMCKGWSYLGEEKQAIWDKAVSVAA